MLLSEHFKTEEFERDGSPIPQEAISSYKSLCEGLLEPVRQQFGVVVVTSGYRSPSANESAHGASNSQHVATDSHCAADFFVKGLSEQRDVFDWLRQSPLLFDQAILEHGLHTDIVHLSWSKTPRREALEGATANRTGYKPWPVS